MATEITLKADGCEVSVRVECDGLSMGAMLDDVIVPALLALGYHPDTIAEYIDRG